MSVGIAATGRSASGGSGFTDDLIARRNSGSRSVGRVNRCTRFVIAPVDVVDHASYFVCILLDNSGPLGVGDGVGRVRCRTVFDQVTIRPSARTHALSVFRGREAPLKADLLVASSAVDIEGVVDLEVASISNVIPDIRVSLRVSGSTREQRRYDENAPHCPVLPDVHWLLPTEDRFRKERLQMGHVSKFIKGNRRAQ
jgi:hypothetical protein